MTGGLNVNRITPKQRPKSTKVTRSQAIELN